jgi:hypothetical protein
MKSMYHREKREKEEDVNPEVTDGRSEKGRRAGERLDDNERAERT